MLNILWSAYRILKKDLHSEFRTRYALNALFMFVVTSLSIVLFALGGEFVNSSILAGVLWIIVFFSAMSGLSRTFVSEEERGTVLLLKLVTSPSAIYLGKLAFNVILTVALNFFIGFTYSILLDEFEIRTHEVFFLTLLLGGIAFASASTILAAIIAKADVKGTLYTVIAFPIVLPLLMTVINATRMAVDGATLADAGGEFQILVAYIVVTITASLMVFEFIWKE